MTTPVDVQAAQAQANADVRSAALRALEASVLAGLLAGVSIAMIRRQLLAAAVIGTFTLGLARPLIGRAFSGVDLSALTAGGASAVALGSSFGGFASTTPPDPPDIVAILRDATARAQAALAVGRNPQESTLTATGSLERGLSVVRASVNGYVERAAAKPAIDDPSPVIWVAERDACVVCLAYAGQISTDGRWPGGRSFDPKRTVHKGKPFEGPPAHPHCRCDVQKVASVEAGRFLARALEREAQRSIAKGWALPSEADSASRRRALARLLSGPNLLPKSVVEEARRNMPTKLAA
jgi:hypothetical protein